jgi:hypothetical protein
MDCLRSFNFSARINTNLSGTDVKTWITGGQHAWAIEAPTFSSVYNIQGFKNINVFGIKAIGTIGTLEGSATGGVIVNDWTIDVTLNGQRPIIGGNITVTPNSYGLDLNSNNNRIFPISKYSNSVEFGDPYQSVTSIELGGTTATGMGWQTLSNVNLLWLLNFVVYYKFEGE